MKDAHPERVPETNSATPSGSDMICHRIRGFREALNPRLLSCSPTGCALSFIMPSISETWGTTAAERLLTFPCDQFIAQPDATVYRGVTVHASASSVFRWLCQLRVAPYSYDWIDNAGKQSPQKLTPGLEEIAVGETAMRIFDVVAVEKERHLTLRFKRGSDASRMFGDVVVSYLVLPEANAAERCRLLAKLMVTYPRGVYGKVMRRVLPWGDLIMMRRQLLNLKRLAEETNSVHPL